MHLLAQEDDVEEPVVIDFDSLQLKVWVAENEFNQQKKTLFATHIWPGSRTLAKHVINNRSLVEGKSVLEFGAGAGIPSMAAKHVGAHFVGCVPGNLRSPFVLVLRMVIVLMLSRNEYPTPPHRTLTRGGAWSLGAG